MPEGRGILAEIGDENNNFMFMCYIVTYLCKWNLCTP